MNAAVVRAEVSVASKAYVDEIVNSITQTQSDWNQTDETAVDFINNKPDVMTRNEINESLETKADADDVRFSTIPSSMPSGTPPEGQVFIWFD